MTSLLGRFGLVALLALLGGAGATGCGGCARTSCGPAGVVVDFGLVGGAPQSSTICIEDACQPGQPDPKDGGRLFVPVADYASLPDEFRMTAEVVYAGQEPASFRGAITKDNPRCSCPLTSVRARPDGSLRG